MWHPDSFAMALASSAVFGVLGILLMVLGFKLFDWACPKIDFEKELAEKGNIAVAIVGAAIIIGVGVVVAAIVGG